MHLLPPALTLPPHAAYLLLVTNLLNQVEIRLREEPEYVPRMVEAKFVEKTLVQALGWWFAVEFACFLVDYF